MSKLASCYQRYAWPVIALFAALAPLIYYGANQARGTSNNNINQWLPEASEETELYRWFRARFGSDEFVLVSWKGCTVGDERLSQFARAVRAGPTGGEPALFQKVTTGPELLERLTMPPFQLSRERAIDRLQGWIIGDDRDLTGALVTLSEYGESDRVAAVQRLRHILSEQIGVPPHEHHLAGGPVVNATIDMASEAALELLPLITVLITCLLAVASLRNVKLTAAVLLTAVFSGGLTQAFIYWTGGNLNLVLVVVPMLVYILSLSAAVHLVNYYSDAVREQGHTAAPTSALRRGFTPCTLAAITTAIGVGSLTVSDIVPVREFGLFSVSGILAGLLILYLLVPSLLIVTSRLPSLRILPSRVANFPARTGKNELTGNKFWARISALVTNRHAAITGMILTCLLVSSWGVKDLRTSVSVNRFFPDDSRLIQDERWFREHFGPFTPLEVVVQFDQDETILSLIVRRLELVTEIENEIANMESIGATISAATFVPPLEEPGGRRSSRGDGLGRAFGFTPGRVRLYVLDDQLEKHRQRLIDNGYLFAQDGQELWRISVRASVSDQGYDVLLDKVATRIREFLDAQDAQRVAGVEVKYTGAIPLFYAAQEELLRGLFRSFLIAFGLIAVLMAGILRNVAGGLLAMIPNVFPAAVVFGIMGHAGWAVDIGAMLTASVAMGIAVDDTVHYLAWFRRGVDAGRERAEAIFYAYRRCAAAMLQTTAIVGFGLLVYTSSTFEPVARFGLLISILLAVTLVGDLVLLPALLAGPAGAVFDQRN